MFKFNKSSSAVPQRTMSIDESPALDPAASTSPSTAEAWLSQCSNASSFMDMSSPEQAMRPPPEKRSSVFKLRARSNTAASTASNISITSTMLRSDNSYRDSQDFRQVDPSGSKRSRFVRGKRSKRLSNAASPNPEVEEMDEEQGTQRRSSVLQKIRRGTTNQSEGSLHRLKHRISSPFDFQHLTHTDREQVGSLESASEHDLVTQYWAARASQAPRRDTTGSQSDNIHFDNFSTENLTTVNTRSTTGFSSPPQSPGPAHGNFYQHSSPESPLGTIRASRSVESFSQPGILSRLHRHTQSAMPSSPCALSRQRISPGEDSGEEQATIRRPRARSNRDSGMWDKFAPLITPPLDKLPTIADEQDYFGHALTTPDNIAIAQPSPSFTPGLEDVAEEPERFTDPRPAPAPPIGSLKAVRSPLSEPFSPRRAQFTRSARSNSRTSIYTQTSKASSQPPSTPASRPMSQMSDTLGSPILPTFAPFHRRQSIRRASIVRRDSNTWRINEESWEDDVDYIYDNAIEANDDFNWELASDDGVYEDRDRTPEQEDHQPEPTPITQRRRSRSISFGDEPTLSPHYFHGAFRPSLLVPSHINVPELESRSAASASTTETGVQTPSDFFASLQGPTISYPVDEGFALSPSLLVPSEYKDDKDTSRESMYAGILSEYEGSDRHFPLLDRDGGAPSVPSSARSSHIRSSKRSSYDSSLMSSAHGSGIWSSPVRRSASSSGSIPELVHSRRSRKDFGAVVEKLSEQVREMEVFDDEKEDGNEDEEITPPGRPMLNQTFFAEDDEDNVLPPQQQQPTSLSTVHSDLKASLELARQGSSRSVRSNTSRMTPSPAPSSLHRHVASEGAAKLFALASASGSAPSTSSTPEPALKLQDPPKKRTRARASSSPYLSLFPTPPRGTPVASPLTTPRSASTSATMAEVKNI